MVAASDEAPVDGLTIDTNGDWTFDPEVTPVMKT